MTPKPTSITSDNFSNIWCRHRFKTASLDSPVVVNEYSECVGKRCPSLVITYVDSDFPDGWSGVCGADFPHFAEKG
jgi:hypothetical protein